MMNRKSLKSARKDFFKSVCESLHFLRCSSFRMSTGANMYMLSSLFSMDKFNVLFAVVLKIIHIFSCLLLIDECYKVGSKR